MNVWHECADIGDATGLYWREDGSDDYVRAVEVTACSDAGGPPELYHLQIGSIYIPRDDDARARAVAMVDGDVASRRDLVEGFRAYHGIDRDGMGGEVVIRIGRERAPYREGGWNPEPDVVLHGNARLALYLRRAVLD